MIQISPGWYEVGRDDGGVAPFLVRVRRRDGCTVVDRGSPRARAQVLSAFDEGWWWHRVCMPDYLPIELVAGTESNTAVWTVTLPPPPKAFH